MTRDIGTILKNAMKVQGLKQKEVAAATHLSQNTISNYINGKRRPDSETLLMLCDLLKLDFRAVVQGGVEEDTIYTLTRQESQLLSSFREITAEEQNNILSYVNFLKDHQAK